MNPPPSSRSTSAIASMPKVTETTMATQGVASSSYSEKAIAEREVTAKNVTGLALGVATDKSTQPCLPPSRQGLMEENTGLDFLPSLFFEPLYQLAGPYTSVPQEKRTRSGKIAKLINTLVSMS